MLGWGFGLAIQYFDAYESGNIFSAENEYKKLKTKIKLIIISNLNV